MLDIPGDIIYLSSCFPYVNMYDSVDSLRPRLQSLLPPIEEAWELVESYFKHATNM